MTTRIERYDMGLTIRFPYGEERQEDAEGQPDIPITAASVLTNAPNPGVFRVLRLQLANVVMVEDVDAYDLRHECDVRKRLDTTLRDMPLTITPANKIRMTVRSSGQFTEPFKKDGFPFALKVLGTMRHVDTISRQEGEPFGDYLKRLDRFTKGIAPDPAHRSAQESWGVWMTDRDGTHGRWLLEDGTPLPFAGTWETANTLADARTKHFPQTRYSVQALPAEKKP